MIKNQLCIALLFFFTLNASASQIYYNPETGEYEERDETIVISRNNIGQNLFVNNQPKKIQSSLMKSSFLKFISSFSIYTGVSGHRTPIDSIKYTMADTNIVSTQQSQSIASQSFIGGNLLVGTEFMVPITERTKFGIGGTYNFTKSAFNQTLSLTAKMPINTFLNSSIYGKISFAMTRRISLYLLGGMQNVDFEIYNYMKQSDGNPWYNKSMPVNPSYDFIGRVSKSAAFFGFGSAYKLSPSTSFFADATYIPISNLNNVQKSDIASTGKYDTQINLITQNKQYYITQLRFGISLNFAGVNKDEI